MNTNTDTPKVLPEAMFKTGLAYCGETVVDRQIEEVWAVVPDYAEWSRGHRGATHTTIRGKRGKVGEVVEIRGKEGSPSAIYAETIRIRPLQTVDGQYRAASIVWRVFDELLSYSCFSDITVREYGGGTILSHCMYYERDPTTDEFIRQRQQLDEGKDALHEHMAPIKQQITETVDRRRSFRAQT